MSYNGSGTFNINTSGQPVVTGTVISSTAFNALTADLGTGLSTAITKDGQTTATARIPFAAGINSSLVTDSTSTTTGSIITAGGVGIAKSLYVGTGITGALNGTVGATTPSTGAFTTLSATGTLAVGSGNSALKIDALGANNFEIYNGALTADGTNYAFAQNYTGANTQVNAASGGQVLLQIAGATKATLDSSGNLGLGGTPVNSGSTTALTIYNATAAALYLQNSTSGTTSSDGATLQLVGADLTITNRENGYIRFNTNNTEVARIDSSGNLLVGTTVVSDISGAGVKINPVGTSNGQVSCVSAASTSGNYSYSMYSTGASAYRFYVDYSGTIHASSIVITSISDERLKENVRDLDIGLDAIMALKPRRFDWKEGKGQDKKDAAGFIAQEFENVFPECVSTSKAGGDGIEYKNINHETLIPTLVKAIQEQQAIITALTTRITALEAK